ncbi:MAG TPA: superoxide dismutase [Candidatus Paceibacterota bacterium]|jgi:Fe-Mn family superoxide dismutase|nr:superoxide dismutase [Candidatus Paceibacterota bacterium]HRS48040.1 superoxide dismutase [Candidatus Paceibacterota bacterium]
MYQLPSLPYNYNALEPYIDAQTMEIHYNKHHQAYTDNFNAALEKHPELFNIPVTELLKDYEKIPEDIRTAVRNQGGGYYNHLLFWDLMSPLKTEPAKELLDAFNKNFGSFEAFKDLFSKTAISHFGSGWAWLVRNQQNELKVLSLPNQDSPLYLELTPILAIDVWEHAYYLKYQNRRAEYVQNWWNVVNWDAVSRFYLA